MYVRWKVLICLAIIFWVLLCLTDYLSIKTIELRTERVKTDENVQPVLAEVIPPVVENLTYIKLAFWNVLAFVSSLSICLTLKSLKSRISTNHHLPIYNELFETNLSSNKIPISVSEKNSSTDIHIEGVTINPYPRNDTIKSYPNLLTLSNVSVDDGYMANGMNDKRIQLIRNMEEHCGKLEEEMKNLQASTLEQHSNILKKFDKLTKEKQDLINQLNAVMEENKMLKQQLEEISEERNVLIKNFECATKELKADIESKKLTSTKLQEAISNVENLKTTLEQITRDKAILVDKFKMLNTKYKCLKEQLTLYNSECHEFITDVSETYRLNDDKEHDIDKYVLSDNANCTDQENMQPEKDFNVSQSEEEMKQVQMKLMSLEKSLENLIFRESTYKTIPEKEIFELQRMNEYLSEEDSVLSIREELFTNSICTDCLLGHTPCQNPECRLKSNHLYPSETFCDVSSSVSIIIERQ